MNHYLESKSRFEILDGLRGVAALVVVFYHLMECYPAEYVGKYFSHGYLAVDFFFALSGFVIGWETGLTRSWSGKSEAPSPASPAGIPSAATIWC